ncbi:hypothetical protein SAMN04488570_2677 [Nocardioides scoriae]|uniref:Uncharacterized protein n=1 Tax=Nocardioides scoriae TaxID=642780 RepID=A0A1H1UZI2_9ACTN|nr:hypothetical protein [Nocardioides scoriae]SDS77932.1 hypothetical protein SAMN04488570_2677 [Nocardioides scoriae]
MTLEFVDDTSEATWLLTCTTDRTAAEAVLWFGPPTFESYARVLQLPDPQFDRQPESEVADEVIDHMLTDAEVIGRTVAALRSRPDPRQVLFFLLWEGYPYRPALPATSRFDVAGLRVCALAMGALDDWTDWGGMPDGGHERGFAPALVWPADRAWCIAFDVESHFAGVGASSGAISRLLETDGLSAERAAYGVPRRTYG